ncbi:MAG: DUF4124 domain-containing protein [Pseudomonadota bacterium]
MNPSRNLIAAVGAIILFHGMAGAATTGSGKAYRWVDRNGVVHIGDSVPPEYASQGQSELNSQGVPLRETQRQLSPAEEAAAQQSSAEAAKRRQRDSFLLSTYSRVRDIEQLRDERLVLLDGQMEIARSSVGSTNQRLVSLRDRMRNFQPYSAAPNARRMPDQLAEEVVRALKEQRSLQEVLASRESEKNQLRNQFDADIARYRELTSRPASR